jgi:hypothetical protein
MFQDENYSLKREGICPIEVPADKLSYAAHIFLLFLP